MVGRRILVVEDDTGIGESLVELFEAEGYRVSWGKDGVEGLELMAREPPSVILLDLKMPRMDGFQFRAVQKRDPLHAEIPVIVLSAHARADEVDAAAFVQKPFDISMLLETVQRYSAGDVTARRG